jgi:hypothetical protein
VLQSITQQPPLLVVEVLPPTRIVRADRLQVSVGYRADPYLFPGWRNDQELAALHVFGGKAVAELVEIDESLAGTPPRPSRVSW